MRIYVTREFAGRLTDERRIYPGVYDLDAKELFSVGQYLLDNGFAAPLVSESELIDPGAGTEFPHFEVVDEAPVDYSAWTVSALKDELVVRGIDVLTLKGTGANGNLLKEDLVLVLQGDDADESASVADAQSVVDTVEFKGRALPVQDAEEA